MKSMTGYAKRQCLVGTKKLTIEIKTLNSKQIDANIKIPTAYREKEMEMRGLLNRLERGKIDFVMSEENTSAASSNLNKELLKGRYLAAKEVADELGCDKAAVFETLLGQNEIWNTAEETTIDDSTWETIKKCIEEAIDDVDAFRQHEGNVLEADFVKHIDLIEAKLAQIPQHEEERITTAKNRIKSYLAEYTTGNVDENRFEQELIYYLEKLDITEEKVRLQKHIDYFRATMAEASSGRKLGFVAQEMGREINTTGSKANHVEIQKLVVEMKDELEKIKEQLGNIL